MAVAILETPTEKSARSVLREWIRDKINGDTEVLAPQIADAALQELTSDTTFMAQFGRETLRSTVYGMVLDVLQSYRTMHGETLELDESTVIEPINTDTRADLERRLARLERKYLRWREHVGDRYISLLAITKEQLQVAIAERAFALAADTRKLDFLRALDIRTKPKQQVAKAVGLDTMEQLCVEYGIEGE